MCPQHSVAQYETMFNSTCPRSVFQFQLSGDHCSDEYANRIPNPHCIPKYTKVKVLSTQDKHLVS